MQRLIIAIILIVFTITGCTSFRSVSIPSDPNDLKYSLRAGDTVKIVTDEGKKATFKIDHISKSALYGDHEVVPFNKIRQIKHQELDKVKTTAAVGSGIVGGTIAVIALACFILVLI